MSGVPILRETLRGLKAKKDEKDRLDKINKCVTDLYRCAVGQAEYSTDTEYRFTLPPIPVTRGINSCNAVSSRPMTRLDNGITIMSDSAEFHRDNMNDILSNLRTLFPDCSVTYTQLARGQDGKMYDISKMDEKVLAFIDKRHNLDCIVIDWS